MADTAYDKPGNAHDDDSPSDAAPDLGRDHNQPAGRASDPRGDNVAAGDSSDPRGEGPDSLGDVRKQEGMGGDRSSGSHEGSQASDKEGGLYNHGGEEGTSGASSIAQAESAAGLAKGFAAGPAGAASAGVGLIGKTLFGSRKRKAGTGIIALLIGMVVTFLIVVSGPLQFVHFAQSLEKWHMRSNEDFGDNRTSKILLYSVTGRGVEKTRLGLMGNKAADVWEKKLVEQTGLRPVYSQTTRRFVGFEIVDENKFSDSIMDGADNTKTSARLDQAMGKGAEITTAGDASAARQAVAGADGKALDPKTKIISLANVKSYGERARFIKTIGSLTDTSKIASTIGSRLLIKRAGVDFHPLKNIKRKVGDKLADYRAKQREATAQQESTGTTEGGTDVKTGTDANGNPNATAADETASEGAKDAIKEAADSTGRDTIKGIVTKLGKGAAVVGVLCAAKGIGNDIPKYKYANDVLPMERMGMTAITTGNQVMSGQDVNLDELGAASESLYDDTTKSSWINAKSVQAESGDPQNGPDIPREARLSNATDKPAFFDVLDKIPLLTQTCSVSSFLGSLPIISDISNLVSGEIADGLDQIAKAFGTSINSVVESALAAVSGKSVNTLAQGAEYGNLANTGAFLAGNDNAISMGGTALSASQVADLKSEQAGVDSETQSTESIAQRYLDPYSNTSLAALLIDRVPPSTSGAVSASTSGMASLITGSIGRLADLFVPKARAAGTPYDYGVPTYGFSIQDQDNPEVEDPYTNAVEIEKPGVLDTLNDKYGKACFGMTVTDTDSGVQVQTEAMGSDDLNVFKVQSKAECNPATNSDPMFLRYRFYLADAVSTESLACYEGTDDQACTDLGLGGGSSSTDTSGGAAATTTAPATTGSGSTGSTPTGSAKDLAKQIVDSGNVTGDSRYMGQIEAVAKGDYSCNVNPHILAMLVGVAVQDKHKIVISSLNRKCTGVLTASGTASYHYADGGGHALDVTGYDGKPVNGSSGGTLEYLKEASKYLPANAGYGQDQCGSGFKYPAGSTHFNDSCDHQHIQVPVEQDK